jgi:hypothetical protein
MQFFPHNIPVTSVASAVSASTAVSASYLNNFAAASVNVVNTASLALNIIGSAGATGTGASVTGPKGPQGIRGVTGFRGDSVYLLSASWYDGSPCGAPPVTCIGYGFGLAYVESNTWVCPDGAITTTYRTTSPTFTTGIAMFTDNNCTEPAPDIPVIGYYLGNIYGITSGQLIQVSTCGASSNA